MPSRAFPEPLIPVAATWMDGSALVEVVFDQPLVEGVLEAGNWSVPGAALSAAHALGAAVRLELIGEPTVVSTVSYSPPPFDVTAAATGTPALAFSDFPVQTT